MASHGEVSLRELAQCAHEGDRAVTLGDTGWRWCDQCGAITAAPEGGWIPSALGARARTASEAEMTPKAGHLSKVTCRDCGREQSLPPREGVLEEALSYGWRINLTTPERSVCPFCVKPSASTH